MASIRCGPARTDGPATAVPRSGPLGDPESDEGRSNAETETEDSSGRQVRVCNYRVIHLLVDLIELN